MDVLVNDYQLSPQDILDELFSPYWERRHYAKFDPQKGSLNNWIAKYINYYLNHIIRRQASLARKQKAGRVDPLDAANRQNLIWADKDNNKEDDDFQPEVFIDPTNPESLLLAKEMMVFILDHFTSEQIQYLTGELELDEVSKLTGISPDAFRKRLERRRNEFLESWRVIEQN